MSGSRGSGGVAGKGGGGSLVAALEKAGFSGAVPQAGLRPESFAHLRSGGAVHGGSPVLRIAHDGTVSIVDGRHRITLAREAGAKSISARVIVEGPRGGVKRYAERKIPLKPSSGKPQKL